MHVLVTGGAGFIGSHIVEYHLNKQDDVHVLDDLSTGSLDNIAAFENNPHFHFIKGDILTFPELEKLVNWSHRIYHMAAVVGVFRILHDSERLLDINITATDRLLRAATRAERAPRILLASTSEVYGDCYSIPANENDNLIIGAGKKSCTAYAVSKIALECFGTSYFNYYELPITSLRFFNTIGPRQIGGYGMVVPRFIKSAVNHEPITVFGTGEQTRSFCDVRDSIVLMDKIANNDKTFGEVLNVGQDREITINALAALIKNIANSLSEIRHITYEEAYGTSFDDMMSRRPDMNKLLTLTHYQYAWNLEKTLADLIMRCKQE